MKRILATILAALLLFGAFAAGTSALASGEPGEPETEVSLAGELGTLTPTQYAGLFSQLAKFTTYMDRVQVERAVALVLALQASEGKPEALKDPAKEAEFSSKVAAALGTVDMTVADAFDELIKAFLEDAEAVVVAAYKDGTLPTQLRTLFGAYLAGFINELQPLVDTYVKPEIVDNAKNYAYLAATLPWLLAAQEGLGPERKEELKAWLLEKRKSIDVKALLRKSAAEYTKAIDNLVIDSRKALAKVSVVVLELREKLPVILRNANKFLQWFYYYVLFGWVAAIFE